MINNTLYPYEPDYAVHPGEYLEEVLEARNIKKNDLAERLGVSEKHISQIINKQALINADLAVKLEKTLGVSANIWSNMSAEYELFIAREKESTQLNQELEWVSNFPLKDLKKLNILPETRDKKILLERLLKFFQIPDPGKFNDYYNTLLAVNFRKSKAFSDNKYHILSWIRAGEISAETISTKIYDKDSFKNNLNKIRELTVKSPEEFESKMVGLCADAGVAVVFVPEFDKTHLSGITRWLNPEKALIIMSLRYKTNDHFWFTFFHEAGHILLHGKKQIFIDEMKPVNKDEQEKEADHFAENILIPEKELWDFIKKDFFDVWDITAFADSIGIHPGIVVGQLQHYKKIGFNRHDKLKDRFEFKP